MYKKILTLITFTTLALTVYFFAFNNSLRTKKVRFQSISNQLEKQFDEPKLKRAAINYSRTIDEAIRRPEDALEIQPRMARSLSCLNVLLDELFPLKEIEINPADLSSKNFRNTKIEDLGNKFLMIQRIRDISVTNDERRVKNYIKFNNNLSGKVFDISIPKISDCN